MTDLLKELKTLNTTLQRLADFYVLALDPDIFDSFKAFRGISCLKCLETIFRPSQEESSSLLRQWKRRCL